MIARRRSWIPLFFCLALFIAACGAPEAPPDAAEGEADGETDTDAELTEDEEPADEEPGEGEQPEPGEVVIALGAEPTTLDPQVRNDGNERAVNHNIYEGLLGRTPEGELAPELAADLPEQLDETTWQFQLREGIEFHDGEPLTAEAVVHSIERLLDPDLASEQAPFLAGITGGEVVDELTVNITTEGPDPLLPARMYWMRVVPVEYSEDPAFDSEPVGTGPYRFAEWRSGESITLEANPDYWDGAPSIDQATFRFVESAGSRLSGLLAEEFDVMVNLLPEDVDRAPNVASVQGLEHTIIILNMMEGITADPQVREALNLAVDREGLAEFLFEGHAVPASHPFGEPTFGYNPELEPHPYDPERAAQLIEEAGVAGETIELHGTSGRWLKDREIVESVAAFWEDAGLTVDVGIHEFGEYLNRLFDRETRADAIFVSHSNELLDADLTMSSYYEMDGTGSSNDDERVTELVQEARNETDEEAREQMYHEALEIAHEGYYFVFLTGNEDIWGLSDRVEWQPRVDFKVLLKDMELTE